MRYVRTIPGTGVERPRFPAFGTRRGQEESAYDEEAQIRGEDNTSKVGCLLGSDGTWKMRRGSVSPSLPSILSCASLHISRMSGCCQHCREREEGLCSICDDCLCLFFSTDFTEHKETDYVMIVLYEACSK